MENKMLNVKNPTYPHANECLCGGLNSPFCNCGCSSPLRTAIQNIPQHSAVLHIPRKMLLSEIYSKLGRMSMQIGVTAMCSTCHCNMLPCFYTLKVNPLLEESMSWKSDGVFTESSPKRLSAPSIMDKGPNSSRG